MPTLAQTKPLHIGQIIRHARFFRSILADVEARISRFGRGFQTEQ